MKVNIITGSITAHKADVIVNSANKSLMRGSGVCSAIHQLAGVELQDECRKIKQRMGIEWLPTGQIVTTKAYNLPHKYVIHAVGPKAGSEKISLLYDCYEKSLKEAERLQAKSISFPAISTNVNGVHIDTSATIVKSVLKNMAQPDSLEEINFFFQNEKDAQVYRRVFSE